MQGPHEADGGPAGPADRRAGQAGRRRPHLPAEPQEGQGQGRGLHQAPRVPHLPAQVGDAHYSDVVYNPLRSGVFCRSKSLSDKIKCILFCLLYSI